MLEEEIIEGHIYRSSHFQGNEVQIRMDNIESKKEMLSTDNNKEEKCAKHYYSSVTRSKD